MNPATVQGLFTGQTDTILPAMLAGWGAVGIGYGVGSVTTWTAYSTARASCGSTPV